MKRKNYLMICLVVIGAILFGIVSYVVINSKRTVSAIVPNKELKAGDKIDASMLSTIQVPIDTPKGYITDKTSLIGQKLKINAQSGQLLYISDIILSWSDVVYGVSVPNDYIVTAINIPNQRAVGGLISVGDTVDILGVQKSVGANNGENANIKDVLGPIAQHSYGADGIHVYWILANVKILETNSSLSNKDDNNLSKIDDGKEGTSDGAYYIVALSYADYQKLVLSQKYLELWMNLSPAWNNKNKPLLDVMQYSEIQGLMDAQSQSIIEKAKGEKEGDVSYKIKKDALDALEKKKKEWKPDQGTAPVVAPVATPAPTQAPVAKPATTQAAATKKP